MKLLKYTEDQRLKVMELRKNGVPLADIVQQTGVSQGTIRSWLNKSGITLSTEQRGTNRSSLSPEQLRQLLLDRSSGVTRKELALKYNMTVAGLKSIFSKNDLQIPMDVRQQNAYQAKLKKNPDAMSQMRQGLTADVVAQRSESVREAYSNPELIEKMGDQSRTWWVTQTNRSSYTWTQFNEALEEVRFTTDVSRQTEPFQTSSKIDVVCHCGIECQVAPHDMLYGKIRSCGCVKSFNEKELLQWVRNLGVEAYPTRGVIGPQEIDIFAPIQNLGIEYCGLWFHGDKYKDPGYHADKMKACEAKGVRLITVFSDEWIERRNAVEGFLRAVFKTPMESVGARECIVRTDRDALRLFVEREHLQGAGGIGQTYVGLSKGTNLVAVMAFRVNDDKTVEISRYCVKNGVSVPGAFNKLMSYIWKNTSATKLISFSDNRWSQGAIYRNAGFEMVNELSPAYWYTKKGNDTWRKHRGAFRKDKISEQFGPLQESETEEAAMKRLGFGRIYDCGYKKWVLTRK